MSTNRQNPRHRMNPQHTDQPIENRTESASRRSSFATSHVLGVLMVAGGGMFLQAQTIVVPNENAEIDANTYNYSSSAEDFSGTRDMMIFDASQFHGLSGPSYLTRFAYRPDNNSSPSGPRSGLMDIFASTTRRSVAEFSTTFAQNVGADNTLVFSGLMTVSTANLPAAGNTRQFDIIFALTNPFLYDPAAGNLVLDFRIFEGRGPAIGWDAVRGNPMVGDILAIGSPDAAVGSTGSAPVIQFTFEPAPRVTIRPLHVEVCWDSLPDETYRVEWSSEAAPSTWQPLVECFRSTDTTACVTDAVVEDEPRKFYRVVQTNCRPQ
jgi:hypothetical protein